MHCSGCSRSSWPPARALNIPTRHLETVLVEVLDKTITAAENINNYRAFFIDGLRQRFQTGYPDLQSGAAHALKVIGKVLKVVRLLPNAPPNPTSET